MIANRAITPYCNQISKEIQGAKGDCEQENQRSMRQLLPLMEPMGNGLETWGNTELAGISIHIWSIYLSVLMQDIECLCVTVLIGEGFEKKAKQKIKDL